MNRRHATLALLGALLLGSSTTQVVHAEGAPTGSNVSPALLRGQVDIANVPAADGGVEWGRAEGVLAARPDDVLAILHDYPRYAGLFPYFEKSKVLSQRGADAIVYLEAKILHGATTLWGQVRISAKDPASETKVVEAKLMKGKGNISQLMARWEVTPVNGGTHTHVVFQLLVDPDLPVPDMVISREMKNGAGQAFRALRRRVNERASIVSRPSSTL
jgi:ribosome-associated toxin RatA of RatAB toxin-antitoxin module